MILLAAKFFLLDEEMKIHCIVQEFVIVYVFLYERIFFSCGKFQKKKMKRYVSINFLF